MLGVLVHLDTPNDSKAPLPLTLRSAQSKINAQTIMILDIIKPAVIKEIWWKRRHKSKDHARGMSS